MHQSQPRVRETNVFIFLSTLVAAMGSFLFGFDTAVISGTTASLRSVFSLDNSALGFVVSSALFGTMAGSALIGWPVERFGRKAVLAWLGALYLVSAVGCAVAWNSAAMVAFRFIGGLAIGGASVVSPMYIAEIAPARLRGRLVAVSQLNIVLGILAAYLSNFILGTLLSGDVAWRWMLGIEALPAALFIVLVSPIPESPRWLVARGQPQRAEDVLRRLGRVAPEAELREIVASIGQTSESGLRLVFQRKYLAPVLLALMVATFNQLSGINALIYYTFEIFKAAAVSDAHALGLSVLIGLVNLVFTLAAMAVIDRFGRRRLLLVGAVGLAVTMAGAAFVSYRQWGVVPLLCCLIPYVASFAFSQGAVVWVFLSEIFPNSVRGQGQTLASFTVWAWNAVVTWSFPVIAGISSGHAFAFFSAMMVLQLVLVWRFLPETKGVSLEEIQRRLGIE